MYMFIIFLQSAPMCRFFEKAKVANTALVPKDAFALRLETTHAILECGSFEKLLCNSA